MDPQHGVTSSEPPTFSHTYSGPHLASQLHTLGSCLPVPGVLPAPVAQLAHLQPALSLACTASLPSPEPPGEWLGQCLQLNAKVFLISDPDVSPQR